MLNIKLQTVEFDVSKMTDCTFCRENVEITTDSILHSHLHVYLPID